MSPDDDSLQRIAGNLTPSREPLGVAVSGGSDSLALLHLLAGRAGLQAVTVNHNLRAEAADEAAGVARICAGLGVPHAILNWHWEGRGNLSEQARQARLSLIAQWARARGIGTVALGHTANDQAETFLMRLARGSGVDGLAAMAPRRQAEGITWVRPLLCVPRQALRAYLTRHGVRWFEDPTNDDAAYLRVRARATLGALEPLGLTLDRLVETAATQAMARQVLEQVAHEAARRIVRIEAGDVVFDRSGLAALLPETRLRLMSHALRWMSQANHRPRLASMVMAWDAITQNRRHTLAGCLLIPTTRSLRVVREWRAVQAIRASLGAPWDQRWLISGPDSNGLEVAALGAQGLAQLPDWRGCGLPRAALIVSPAVWQGPHLVAAPLAGQTGTYHARLTQDADEFFTSLLSH